ncbi:MAG: rod shape-determining protein MreD [Phycisphaerae bacterium]
MRWIAFAILLYLITVLQTSAVPFLAVHTVRPDLMVILAVHYALLAPAADAMLACWCIGLVIDLAGMSYAQHSNVGVNALALGLLGLFIVKVRELTFRESPVTQLAFALIVKLALALLVGLHMLYVLDAWDRFGEVLTTAIWSAVYTAVLAPYAHWVLRRFRRVLGVGVAHRLRVR